MSMKEDRGGETEMCEQSGLGRDKVFMNPQIKVGQQICDIRPHTGANQCQYLQGEPESNK